VNASDVDSTKKNKQELKAIHSIKELGLVPA